jgi:hypothetical protein
VCVCATSAARLEIDYTSVFNRGIAYPRLRRIVAFFKFIAFNVKKKKTTKSPEHRYRAATESLETKSLECSICIITPFPLFSVLCSGQDLGKTKTQFVVDSDPYESDTSRNEAAPQAWAQWRLLCLYHPNGNHVVLDTMVVRRWFW